MATTTISRTEYVRDRRAQDTKIDVLGDDVREVKTSVEHVEQDMVEVKKDVAELKKDMVEVKKDVAELKKDMVEMKKDVAELKKDMVEMKKDIAEVKKRVTGLENGMTLVIFEQKRSSAWFRNQFKKIPTLRIDPIPVWRPSEKRSVLPSMDRFPRNANEFYALRNALPGRPRHMLRYLVLFYDVSWPGKPYDSFTTEASGDTGATKSTEVALEGNREEDELYDVLADLDTASLVVDILEGILGLSEDNFKVFAERARQREEQQDAMGPSAPKRKQTQPPSGEPVPVRLALDVPPAAASEQPLRPSPTSSHKDPSLPDTQSIPGAQTSSHRDPSLPDTQSVPGAQSTRSGS